MEGMYWLNVLVSYEMSLKAQFVLGYLYWPSTTQVLSSYQFSCLKDCWLVQIHWITAEIATPNAVVSNSTANENGRTVTAQHDKQSSPIASDNDKHEQNNEELVSVSIRNSTLFLQLK